MAPRKRVCNVLSFSARVKEVLLSGAKVAPNERAVSARAHGSGHRYAFPSDVSSFSGTHLRQPHSAETAREADPLPQTVRDARRQGGGSSELRHPPRFGENQPTAPNEQSSRARTPRGLACRALPVARYPLANFELHARRAPPLAGYPLADFGLHVRRLTPRRPVVSARERGRTRRALPPALPQRRIRWLNASRFQFSIGSACPPSFGQGGGTRVQGRHPHPTRPPRLQAFSAMLTPPAARLNRRPIAVVDSLITTPCWFSK